MKFFAFVAMMLAAISMVCGVIMAMQPTTFFFGIVIVLLAAIANGRAILLLEKK